MIAVGRLNDGGLPGSDTVDFGIRKPIGLLIRETPVRFAVVGADRGRSAIPLDRVPRLTERLQRMSDQQMELGIIRRLGQDLSIQRRGLRVVPESRAYRPTGGAV